MGVAWSDAELAAAVDAYQQMAKREAAGEPYSKKQVYRDLAKRFNRTEKSFEYRMQNISAVLDELGRSWIPGLKPATNVGEGVKPRLVAIIKKNSGSAPAGQFRYGDSRTWELALQAVVALGGSATPQDILTWIVERHPDYNKNNLLADLAMLSVNSPSRTAYGHNTKPRKTDQGSQFDRLFKVGIGKGVRYELYDPALHGVWEIYPEPTSNMKSGMSIRQSTNPVLKGLDAATSEAEATSAFDASDVEDARKRVYSAIVRRRGQPAFRKALMSAYGGACAITGCNLPAVLEAAHIHPYMGDHTNVVSNGLLLRTDIHTLFDLGMITVDSETMQILVSPELDDTEYKELVGTHLRPTQNTAQKVSADALRWHHSRCGWIAS